LIGRVFFQSKRYILINWKETFWSTRWPVDRKAFLLVNLAGRNPSQPQDYTLLRLGGVPTSLKTINS
jgi:hypothetical protein